jgi:hypothetical protein
MGREEQLLSESIKDSFYEGEKAATKLLDVLHRINGVEELDAEGFSPLQEAQDTLEWYIERLYRDVGILAERMALPLVANQIVKEFASIKKTTLTNMEPSPYDVHLVSPHLTRIRGHFDSIAVMTDGRAVTGLDTFRTILQNTAGIIKLTKIEPANEADVRNAVFNVLKIAFHDAIREIPIAQLLKTYKPDLGVRSLMAAAEYKFVEDEKQLKSALEGIYADMKGYGGHYEWRTFFAVIYTTDSILHPERLAEEFRGVKADLSWTPILIVGKGARRRNSIKTTR